MKTWDELVAAELRSYLRWLRALEISALTKPPYDARWYKGRLIDVYTRAGRDYFYLENESFICLATIKVKDEHQGKGLFTSLLECIQNHRDQLRATHLVVESVANPRLATKLDRLGFTRFVLAYADSSPTFYRRLSASSPNPIELPKPPARRLLSFKLDPIESVPWRLQANQMNKPQS